MKAIKAAGGITFAQDEQSAKYAGMPHSALRSGCIDFVLPPDAIARELSRMAQHPYLVPAPAGERASPGDEGEQFNKILSLLRASFNVDFSVYRDTTIRRRIMRRMVLHTKENLGEYVQLLEKDRPELEALYTDLHAHPELSMQETRTAGISVPGIPLRIELKRFASEPPRRYCPVVRSAPRPPSPFAPWQ